MALSVLRYELLNFFCLAIKNSLKRIKWNSRESIKLRINWKNLINYLNYSHSHSTDYLDQTRNYFREVTSSIICRKPSSR